jgi:hypothetical protein
MAEYAGLLLPFLNRDILKLTINAPPYMLLHIKVEIIHYHETNHKIFDIDMSVWDNTSSVTDPISFH